MMRLHALVVGRGKEGKSRDHHDDEASCALSALLFSSSLCHFANREPPKQTGPSSRRKKRRVPKWFACVSPLPLPVVCGTWVMGTAVVGHHPQELVGSSNRHPPPPHTAHSKAAHGQRRNPCSRTRPPHVCPRARRTP